MARSCAGLLGALVDPVVETGTVAGNLDGVELHANTEDGGVLVVLDIGAGAQDCAEVVVVDLVLELVDPVAPLLLSGLALHLVLVDGTGRVEVGECLHEGCVDLVVHLGQAQLGALDLLQDGPVCHQVLDGYWEEYVSSFWSIVFLNRPIISRYIGSRLVTNP